MTLSQEIIETINHTAEIGPFAALLEMEVEKGYRPVFPGEVGWLPKADWPDEIVVSLDGNTVRIVAIRARHPGTGAFRRLIAAIIKAGLHPVIIAPLFAMPEILTRWGWSQRFVGSTFHDREEQWYPCALLRRVG